MREVGSIIGLRPEFEAQYTTLHQHVFPGVLDRISRSNIRNYSIFLRDSVLFSYYEYEGTDYVADMAAIGEDATTRQWWTLTDAMQIRLDERAEGEWWAMLPLVYETGACEDMGNRRRLAFVSNTGLITPRRGGQPARDAGILRLLAFQGRGSVYVYVEVGPELEADPQRISRAVTDELGSDVPLDAMLEVFHTDVFGASGIPARSVFVSGCFDMLHSGHVAFLKEAASYGRLYVGIGSDRTIGELKGRQTVNSQAERQYMIDALDCVTECRVNRGSGVIDFISELDDIRPDVFIVNEDGHMPAKEALCGERGIEYVVLKRVPHEGMPARSTTTLRSECRIPFRIDLAGGWLDQPYVSTFHPGAVLTISIEPTIDFNDRSGMASSTRRKAMQLWHHAIPQGEREQLAQVLFSFENPPGTKEVAGSQDALGIVLPGLNRLDYEGGYWPARITSVHDEVVLEWLESRLYLVTLGPRNSSYAVLDDTRIDAPGAKALADAADACWYAVLERNATAFGEAFRRSFEAQVAMFPRMMDGSVNAAIERYKDRSLGWKLSGAGGGGYLILVAETAVPEAMQIRIRRRGTL